jgi:hypothetical protein
MQNPMIENLVQFTHLEKLYVYLPGMDETLMARLSGLELEDYREVKARFDANAREAARELLEDASFVRLLLTGCRSGKGRPCSASATASRTTFSRGSR